MQRTAPNSQGRPENHARANETGAAHAVRVTPSKDFTPSDARKCAGVRAGGAVAADCEVYDSQGATIDSGVQPGNVCFSCSATHTPGSAGCQACVSRKPNGDQTTEHLRGEVAPPRLQIRPKRDQLDPIALPGPPRGLLRSVPTSNQAPGLSHSPGHLPCAPHTGESVWTFTRLNPIVFSLQELGISPGMRRPPANMNTPNRDGSLNDGLAADVARAGRRALRRLALALLLSVPPAALAEKYELPLFVASTTSGQQGMLRILNHSDEPGTVGIVAIDDAGTRSGAATLALGALAGVNLDAADLESGNATKGVTGGIGSIQGSVRLEFDTELAVQLLAYLRTADGTLSVLHGEVSPATLAEDGSHSYLVPTFNAAQEMAQMSQLRLVNSTQMAATVTIEGRDDAGAEATGENVELTLPAGGATTLTAQQLEAGGTGLTGQMGTGTGQWRLRISSDQLIEVISLVESSTGHLANLSTPGRGVMEAPADSSPSFEEASAPGDQTYTTDTAITALTLPEATGGDGTLTYALTPEVPGLTFSVNTRQLTGTPTTEGTHSMAYTATDEDGDTATLTFTITVQAADGGMTGAGGDCHVGLRVSPGGGCTYPGTDSDFTVDADGRARFLVVSSSRAINVNNVTYQGTFYDFRASHQGDGVWRIDRIDGDTEERTTPPSGGEGRSRRTPPRSFRPRAGPGTRPTGSERPSRPSHSRRPPAATAR